MHINYVYVNYIYIIYDCTCTEKAVGWCAKVANMLLINSYSEPRLHAVTWPWSLTSDLEIFLSIPTHVMNMCGRASFKKLSQSDSEGGAENAGVENAGVENAGVDRTDRKCRSGKYRSDNVNCLRLWRVYKYAIVWTARLCLKLAHRPNYIHECRS